MRMHNSNIYHMPFKTVVMFDLRDSCKCSKFVKRYILSPLANFGISKGITWSGNGRIGALRFQDFLCVERWVGWDHWSLSRWRFCTFCWEGESDDDRMKTANNAASESNAIQAIVLILLTFVKDFRVLANSLLWEGLTAAHWETSVLPAEYWYIGREI